MGVEATVLWLEPVRVVRNKTAVHVQTAIAHLLNTCTVTIRAGKDTSSVHQLRQLWGVVLGVCDLQLEHSDTSKFRNETWIDFLSYFAPRAVCAYDEIESVDCSVVENKRSTFHLFEMDLSETGTINLGAFFDLVVFSDCVSFEMVFQLLVYDGHVLTIIPSVLKKLIKDLGFLESC
ncbi:hypothetical protein HG531_000279 [Fusarium graminearum]|nr:hypothetical protein HG531_000279 [Fusarium graminearum]